MRSGSQGVSMQWTVKHRIVGRLLLEMITESPENCYSYPMTLIVPYAIPTLVL